MPFRQLAFCPLPFHQPLNQPSFKTNNVNTESFRVDEAVHFHMFNEMVHLLRAWQNGSWRNGKLTKQHSTKYSVMLRSDNNQLPVPQRNKGVSISGDEADGLDGQVERQRVKLLQGQEVTQDELAVFVAAHEERVVDGLARRCYKTLFLCFWRGAKWTYKIAKSLPRTNTPGYFATSFLRAGTHKLES